MFPYNLACAFPGAALAEPDCPPLAELLHLFAERGECAAGFFNDIGSVV